MPSSKNHILSQILREIFFLNLKIIHFQIDRNTIENLPLNNKVKTGE